MRPAPLRTSRRAPTIPTPPPAAAPQPDDRLAEIVAHLEYLGYRVDPPEPDGWSLAQHQARYDFHLRVFEWGLRLHCAVAVGAAAGNAREAWLDYLNTANEQGRVTQFSLFKDNFGGYGVRMRAVISGAYSRPVFATMIDMWLDDLDRIRRRPEFTAAENKRDEGAVAPTTVH